MILGMICGGIVKAAGDALSPACLSDQAHLTPSHVAASLAMKDTVMCDNAMPSRIVDSMHPAELQVHADKLAQQIFIIVEQTVQ